MLKLPRERKEKEEEDERKRGWTYRSISDNWRVRVTEQ